MNKKYYYGLFAAGMLFATSCSNDELTQVQSGEYAEVSISLGVEEVAGSRAISDGKGANELHYAVFDAQGKRIEGIKPVQDKEVTFPTTETLTLAKGQTYKVAFWAQNKACQAYTVSPEMNVTVDYKGVNNDETRDAFFKTVEFTVNGSTALDVELTRPFAQINVGVDAADWNAAVASGVEIKESNVTIKQAAKAINLVTGKVSTPVDVEYTTAAIPNEPLKANNGTYNWLSMSYILVFDGEESANGAQDATLTSLAYTFTPKSGKPIAFKDGLNNVPVKRNWRTNILGKILTGDITFNISIDPIYEGDKNYPDGSAQELELAAKMGGTVTLTEDVTLDAPLKVVADMVLDLNGHTINNPNDYAIENTGNLTISGNGGFTGLGGIRSKGGKITINGGQYTASSKWDGNPKTYQHILKAENTEVVINGGIFNATIGGTNNAMINVSEGSTVTINGGEFRNVADGETIPQFAPYMFTYEKNGKLIINGGDFYGGWRFNGETTTTDIYGGNFTVSYDGQSFHANSTHVLTIYGGTFSTNNGGKLNPTNHLAEGCYALEYETGVYTVQKFDAASRTLTINSKEELLKLNALNAKWADFFSNGNGTTYTDFTTQNGGKGTDFYYKWDWTIKLNADIDFENETLDAPINLSSFGCFDGQNHTIKNVNITTSQTEKTAAGLFIASKHAAIKNLKLDNVHVTGSFVGSSTAGILVSDCNSAIDNITITNSSVEGGKYTGGVVGYGYCDVTNCTLTDCVVKGGYKLGGVIGYICASDANGHNVTGNTLTNCTVQGAGQFADGKSEYVIGMVVGNYNCNGTCSDNTVDNMTTNAKGIIGKIEAGKNVEIKGQTFYVSTQNQLNAALSESSIGTVYLGAGTYIAFPASSLKEGVTLVCEEGTVFEGKSGLNINGATVVGATFSNPNNVAVAGTIHGTFKDCVFEGNEALRWCYSEVGKPVVFENCEIKTDFRGFHFDGMKGDVIFRNCKINGFNAYGGEGTITFEGCTFGNDTSSYNGLNIYANTILKDCKFVFESGKTNFIDMEGIGKTLSITNCTATIDGAAADIKIYIGGSKKDQNTITLDGVTL